MPPACGKAALSEVLRRHLDREDGGDYVAPRVLVDDAAARRKDGFDVDCWLLFSGADAAKDAARELADARLDAPTPPALAAAPLPWDVASAGRARGLLNDDGAEAELEIPVRWSVPFQRMARACRRREKTAETGPRLFENVVPL